MFGTHSDFSGAADSSVDTATMAVPAIQLGSIAKRLGRQADGLPPKCPPSSGTGQGATMRQAQLATAAASVPVLDPVERGRPSFGDRGPVADAGRFLL